MWALLNILSLPVASSVDCTFIAYNDSGCSQPLATYTWSGETLGQCANASLTSYQMTPTWTWPPPNLLRVNVHSCNVNSVGLEHYFNVLMDIGTVPGDCTFSSACAQDDTLQQGFQCEAMSFACFPPTALVHRRVNNTWEQVEIGRLLLGDRLMCVIPNPLGPNATSTTIGECEMFRHSHTQFDSMTLYLEIEYDGGALHISHTHQMWSCEVNPELEGQEVVRPLNTMPECFVPAHKVKEGHFIVAYDKTTSTLRYRRVTFVQEVRLIGLANPLVSAGGLLIVDDVLATTSAMDVIGHWATWFLYTGQLEVPPALVGKPYTNAEVYLRDSQLSLDIVDHHVMAREKKEKGVLFDEMSFVSRAMKLNENKRPTMNELSSLFFSAFSDWTGTCPDFHLRSERARKIGNNSEPLALQLRRQQRLQEVQARRQPKNLLSLHASSSSSSSSSSSLSAATKGSKRRPLNHVDYSEFHVQVNCTCIPTPRPTKAPTRLPTRLPTPVPTKTPTPPTTAAPSNVPTNWPTSIPTTITPTSTPTLTPTAQVCNNLQANISLQCNSTAGAPTPGVVTDSPTVAPSIPVVQILGGLGDVLSPVVDLTSVTPLPAGTEIQFFLPVSQETEALVKNACGSSQESECMWYAQNVSSWSTSGCRVASRAAEGVLCACTHLTEFAVILRRLQGDLCSLDASVIDYLFGPLYTLLFLTCSYQCFRLRKLFRSPLFLQHLALLVVSALRAVLLFLEPMLSLYGIAILSAFAHTVEFVLFTFIVVVWAATGLFALERNPFQRLRPAFLLAVVVIVLVGVGMPLSQPLAPNAIEWVRATCYTLASITILACIGIAASGYSITRQLGMTMTSTGSRSLQRKLAIVSTVLSACFFMQSLLWVVSVLEVVAQSAGAVLAVLACYYIFDLLLLCVMLWLFKDAVRSATKPGGRRLQNQSSELSLPKQPGSSRTLEQVK